MSIDERNIKIMETLVVMNLAGTRIKLFGCVPNEEQDLRWQGQLQVASLKN